MNTTKKALKVLRNLRKTSASAKVRVKKRGTFPHPKDKNNRSVSDRLLTFFELKLLSPFYLFHADL